MSVAEMVGIAELAPLETWQLAPLALLVLTFWGMFVKIMTSSEDGSAPDPRYTQLHAFGSYFSEIAMARVAPKAPQKLTAVAVDSKEVAALLKTLQTATDRLQKEACAAIVEAILAADATVAEATRANPYVEPPPVAPQAAPAVEEAPLAADESGASAEEAAVEEPAPAEPATEEPEAPPGPSKKTKKKKEKASREAAPSPEPPEEAEPTPEEVMAIVEAAEAEEQVFHEPPKHKKKKNRRKKLAEEEEEDEEDEEAEVAQQAADTEFVPVEAHPEAEADEEQAEEAAAEAEQQEEEEEEEEDDEDEEEEDEAAEAEDAEAEAEADADAEEEQEGGQPGVASYDIYTPHGDGGAALDKDEEDEEEEDDNDDDEEEDKEGEAKGQAAEAAPDGEEAAAGEPAEEAEEASAEVAAPAEEEEEEWEPPPPQPPTDLQKNIMKVKKKIREIEELETKQEAGTTLTANQVAKVAKKPELQTELSDLENTDEPHTLMWNGTVVEQMKPLLGVKVKVEGQGADKGPFPLWASHMNPPVATDDLNSIMTRYTKGTELKVRVLRDGERICDMSVQEEDKRWKVVKGISEKLAELREEDKRVTDALWETCGTWSDVEYTGTTTSVKDFGVFVLLEFGRFVLVRPDDLRPEWRFQDKTTNLARPKRDLVKTGMTVQVRLKYVDNPKKDPNDNYYGSMIASK